MLNPFGRMAPLKGGTRTSTLPYVYDGDTVFYDGEWCRLWGIDAPEVAQHPVGPWARLALIHYLEQAVMIPSSVGGPNPLTFRWRGRDKYKRALCVIETLAPLGPGPTDIVWKTKRSKAARAVAELQLAPDVGPPYDLNRQMVLFGWACSYDAYFQEEAEAQGASRAIWSVNFKHPTVFRKEKK